MSMTLAEGTYYRHPEYGRVELVTVADSRVGFIVESTERAEAEPKAAFREAAEPAPATISAPVTRIALDTNPPGN